MAALNQSLFQFIHHFAGRYSLLDDFGIFLSQYLAYFMVAGFLVLVYRENGWRKRLYVFAEGVLAVILARGLLTEIIRFFYHHERPFSFYNFTPLIRESGWSLPSGHAAFFFALGVAVWYRNRAWGGWYLALAVLMGVARIYAGVHWPLDIAAGAAIGAGAGAAAGAGAGAGAGVWARTGVRLVAPSRPTAVMIAVSLRIWVSSCFSSVRSEPSVRPSPPLSDLAVIAQSARAGNGILEKAQQNPQLNVRSGWY